jgi:hypothetical protein
MVTKGIYVWKEKSRKWILTLVVIVLYDIIKRAVGSLTYVYYTRLVCLVYTYHFELESKSKQEWTNVIKYENESSVFVGGKLNKNHLIYKREEKKKDCVIYTHISSANYIMIIYIYIDQNNLTVWWVVFVYDEHFFCILKFKLIDAVRDSSC